MDLNQLLHTLLDYPVDAGYPNTKGYLGPYMRTVNIIYKTIVEEGISLDVLKKFLIMRTHL